jgi:two-component system, chemotaxis family, sensor kinase CheA
MKSLEGIQSKFIEEAYDNINDLENALLLLEANPEDMEIVERIFRAMHSLKGGGAMFGFARLSDFTHHMENIYDLVRAGKLRISKTMLTITLDSVDLMKKLLNKDEIDTVETNSEYDSLVNSIKKIITGEAGGQPAINVKNSGQQNPDSKLEGISTYYILFVPDQDIMDNGTNPLYLIDELHSIGKSKVLPNTSKVPDLNNLDISGCYTSWEVFLSTKHDVNAISDVFMFVEDQCILDIHKISDNDLLSDERFIEHVGEYARAGREAGITNVREIVNQLHTEDLGRQLLTAKRKTINGKENVITSIRVSSDKIDELMNLVSEMVITQASLSLYAENSHAADLQPIAESVQKLTRQLRDNAFSISLIPLESMMTRFQRLVRDLSEELNKEISFSAEGTETELDKTIIENLTDPLLHIFRNSIDHGIELPSERKRRGKPRNGEIKLKAFYSGANVIIKVSDDGAGVNPEQIRLKAIEKQIIAPDAVLSEKELLNLLFLPGFSTAKVITDVSGRGVGMDVVRRKISSIRGEVEIDSEFGIGTTITIKLPLTLSIIDGLLVKIAKSQYVIPLSMVHKIYSIENEKLAKAFNNLVVLDGNQVPFFYLREEFDEEGKAPPVEEIVVVQYENVIVGLVTDNVIGEYQAVLKPLGKFFKNQEIISGATILGDGSIALVLDTNKIIAQFSSQTKIKEEVK